MKYKLVISVLVALSVSTSLASAQGPAGNGRGAAAIPGSEVRAGEAHRLNPKARMARSFAMMRRERNVVAQPEPVTVAPYINFDATEMAPAGH